MTTPSTRSLRAESDAPPWTGERTLGEAIPAATELFKEDTVPAHVFWIADGIVELRQRRRGPGAPLLIGLRFPGWIVGADSAINATRAPMAAVTLTPCLLHRLPRQSFVRQVKSDASLSWRVSEILGRELFDLMTRATERRLPPQQRLRTLLKQIVEANDATPIDKTIRLHLPLSEARLAQLLLVPVAQVRTLFAQLEHEEYLRVDGDDVIITSPRRLRRAHARDVGWPVNMWWPGERRRGSSTDTT